MVQATRERASPLVEDRLDPAPVEVTDEGRVTLEHGHEAEVLVFDLKP